MTGKRAGGLNEDKGGAAMLREEEIRETILAYAAANMRRKKAASALFICDATMEYRLRQIKIKTGLDPKKFEELAVLIKKMK